MPATASRRLATLSSMARRSSRESCERSSRCSVRSVAFRIVSASLRASISWRSAEILFGEFDGFFEHALDFGVVQAVAGLHFDGVFLAGAQIARGYLQDAVGVDQEFHFDAGEACGAWRNF